MIFPSLQAHKIQVLPGSVWLGALLYFLASIRQRVNIYDEGAAVYGAIRVLNGEIPYRDFWSIYAPGQHYVLAALFRIFGASILVERIWDSVVRATVVLIVYLIISRWDSKTAWVTCFLVTILLVPPGFYFGYAAFPALLSSLLGVLFLMQYVSDRQTRWLVAGGIAVGLAATWRHDFGIYAFVSVGLALGLFTFLNVPPRAHFEFAKLGLVTRATFSFTAGVAMVIAPLGFYFAISVPVDVLWADLVVFPTAMFHAIRALPYPALVPESREGLAEWLQFYLPALLIAMAMVVSARGFVPGHGEHDGAKRLASVLLIELGAFLFLQALSRNDAMHRLQSLIPAVILLMAFDSRRLTAKVARGVLIALVILFYALPAGMGWVLSLSQVNQNDPIWLERAGFVSIRSDQAQAVAYIQRVTSKKEKIFVGNWRHDTIFVNDIVFYFLADRESATRYHELHSGVATTLPVQMEIASDLATQRVEFIVLVAGQDLVSNEPNRSRESSGVTYLDETIRQRYQLVEQFGNYSIWSRRQ